jgi:hypothetical protein
MKSRTDERQLTFEALFEIPEPPKPIGGSLNYDVELHHVISDALKGSVRSRFEIAARMSEMLGVEITKNMLDTWSAESRSNWRFPFEYAAAFEEAAGTYALTELLARKRGAKIFIGAEALKAELGRLEMQESELKRKKSLLKRHLEGK